jgi:Ran GTPase-activating protein (RanGAP) involved in mRNA processing and transport
VRTSVAAVAELLAQMKSSHDWDTLLLSGNTFSFEALKAVSEALENMPNVKHAKFADIFTRRLPQDVHPSLVRVHFFFT